MTVASLSVQEAIKNNFKVIFFFLKKGGYREKKKTEEMKNLHKDKMAQNKSQNMHIASRNTTLHSRIKE